MISTDASRVLSPVTALSAGMSLIFRGHYSRPFCFECDPSSFGVSACTCPTVEATEVTTGSDSFDVFSSSAMLGAFTLSLSVPQEIHPGRTDESGRRFSDNMVLPSSSTTVLTGAHTHELRPSSPPCPMSEASTNAAVAAALTRSCAAKSSSTASGSGRQICPADCQ